MRTCSAAQGSRPGPTSPDSACRVMAAGMASDPLRPRNERRSADTECGGSLTLANATRVANSWLYGLVARMAADVPVVFRDDVQVLPRSRRAQAPFGIAERAQPPATAGAVRNRQERELHRIEWHPRTPPVPARCRATHARSGTRPPCAAPHSGRSRASAVRAPVSGTRRRRCPHRGGRRPHRSDRSPGHWQTA